MDYLLYHCSPRSDLRKLRPFQPKKKAHKAIYLAPDLQELAYWQERLEEESAEEGKMVLYRFVYEVTINETYTMYTDGDIPGTHIIWVPRSKTWLGQVWTSKPIKRIRLLSEMKLYDETE